MFFRSELTKQDKTIKNFILIGFLPTIILVVILFFYQKNSVSFNEKLYIYEKNKEYRGIIIRKTEEGDYPRARRTFILDSNIEEFLYEEEFNKVSIGDSVIKRKGSDSTMFYLKNGKVLYKDYNKFLREKYFELLKKSK